MALDTDGSRFLAVNTDTGAVAEVTSSSDIAKTQDQFHDVAFRVGGGGSYAVASSSTNGAVCVLFPELRDVTHYVYGTRSFSSRTVQVSANTTNGYDGTWTTLANAVNAAETDVSPYYRNAITALSGATGIKAIRFPVGYNAADYYVYTLHLFGDYASGANPDRLEFWKPSTNAIFDTAFDFEESARSTSQTKQFRIKNLSSTLTANSINLTLEDSNPDSSPSFTDAHEFSANGTSGWAASLNIGNLAPGAISSVIYCRSTMGSTQPLSLQASRMRATAGSWT